MTSNSRIESRVMTEMKTIKVVAAIIRSKGVCPLYVANSHAEYLIQRALGYEKNAEVIKVLHAALKEVNPTASVAAAPIEVPKKEDLPIAVIEENTFDANSVPVTSVVHHKACGEGVVSLITDVKIYVNFGEKQRIFQYPGAFEKGWLRL